MPIDELALLADLSPEFKNKILSPYEVRMPASVKAQAEAFVEELYALSSSSEYRSFFSAESEAKGLIDPGNHSILMCYDFHLTADFKLKLIEINTNASLLLPSLGLYQQRNMVRPFGFSAGQIKSDLEKEWALFVRAEGPLQRLAIIDEKPDEQPMYPEFKLYKKLFESWGYHCEILDYRQLRYNTETQRLESPSMSFDFVYNRYCDFLFEDNNSRDLKLALREGKTCLSPQPFEYFLLADKERMVDWHKPDFRERFSPQFPEALKLIEEIVPESRPMADWNLEELWSQRKRYFIKPLRSYGSKQTYKAASISRKLFDELDPAEFLIQEYIPAPKVEFQQEEKTFKYDLRFYAYQGQIEHGVARLYQGQVTNMRTENGGLAPLIFE